MAEGERSWVKARARHWTRRAAGVEEGPQSAPALKAEGGGGGGRSRAISLSSRPKEGLLCLHRDPNSIPAQKIRAAPAINQSGQTGWKWKASKVTKQTSSPPSGQEGAKAGQPQADS